MVTTSDHEHHFCTTNTGGIIRCCQCGQPLYGNSLSLTARVIRVVQWVDANLFFVNRKDH